ncbi:DAHL domain-containing protein [Capilliphycus salinus ALCB114379]|uniref:DAHL domain-containing protein n=1 Tax=Capilliphycus salinus TaxID=2768948 RepID=UPI0039A54EB0
MAWFTFRHPTTTQSAVERSDNRRTGKTWFKDYFLPTGATVLFLLFWMKSQAVNLSQHNRYLDALRQLQELDARVNQDVLQLRLGLLDYYDPIVNHQAKILELHDILEQPPGFTGSVRQKLIAQVRDNIQLWQEKDTLIQQFKSKHSILRNSLTYFPIAIADFSTQPDVNPKLAAELNTLLQNILLFNLSTDEEKIPDLTTDLEKLRFSANEDLSNVLAHAEIILKYRSETDNLIETILTKPTRQQEMELAKTYEIACSAGNWVGKPLPSVVLRPVYAAGDGDRYLYHLQAENRSQGVTTKRNSTTQYF